MIELRRNETLTEYQARMARRLGYTPLVFGTDGRFGPIHRWWDGRTWRSESFADRFRFDVKRGSRKAQSS